MIGWGIGAFEILFFMLITGSFKYFFNSLRQINSICYYWLCMTTLTGIWEASYLTNYDTIVSYANELIQKNAHVWTSQYDFSYLLPWKLAYIFYAEYGAWADREYMSLQDPWSHTVEGTHMIFCAVFAFFGLLSGFEKKTVKSLICVSMAMAFQLMNSVMYMIEYNIQTTEIYSVNYDNNTSFPLGTAMIKRPFMYVNIFWLIMPTYIIFFELFNLTILNKALINSSTNNTTNTDTPLIVLNEKQTKISQGKKYTELDCEDPPPHYETEIEN